MNYLGSLAVVGLLTMQVLFAQNTPKNPVEPSIRLALPAPEPENSGKIYGLFLDQITDEPVRFAAVDLVHKATGQTVATTQTDKNGHLTLERITAGDYKLVVNSEGYETAIIDSIKIVSGPDKINVGVVTLTPTVITQKDLFAKEELLTVTPEDDLLDNPENEITIIQGTPAELLNDASCLGLDLEVRVSFNQFSKIQYWVNNEPTVINRNQIAAALQNLIAKPLTIVEIKIITFVEEQVEDAKSVEINITKTKDL